MNIGIGNFSSSIINLLSDEKLKFNQEYFNDLKHDQSFSSLKEYEDFFIFEDFGFEIENKIVSIFIDAESVISGISLKLLEGLKKANNKILVYLFFKDKKVLTKTLKENQNLNFNVYTDIARCGEIDRLFLIDLSLVISKFSISLKNFENNLVITTANLISNILYILNINPIYGSNFTTNDIKRISTFGIILMNNLDSNSKEEFYFYDFKNDILCQKHYSFLLNEEELNNGNYTISRINTLLDNKENNSYSIYESINNTSVYYAIKSTSYVERE